MTTTRCPWPHVKDPDRPRATGDGIRICLGHRAGLDRYVDEAPRLDLDLLRAYTAATSAGEKVRSSRTPGLNIRDDVLEARTWLHQVYRAWTAHVANSRGWHVTLGGASVETMARLLKTNLDWLAAGDDVEDLHSDLTATVQLGRRIVAPTGVRTLPIGQCVEDGSCTVETREGVPCNGTLQVTLYPEDPSLPSPHLIVCTDCGAHYLPAKWLKLGERVHARQVARA
jgi:hypothetical protein